MKHSHDVVAVDYERHVRILLLYNTSYEACHNYCVNNKWIYQEGPYEYNLEIIRSGND